MAIGFGLELLDLPEATHFVRGRLDGEAEAPDPPAFALFYFHAVDQYFLRPHHPDQLLRNVKQSHQIDLAYLFISTFLLCVHSKDRLPRGGRPAISQSATNLREWRRR